MFAFSLTFHYFDETKTDQNTFILCDKLQVIIFIAHNFSQNCLTCVAGKFIFYFLNSSDSRFVRYLHLFMKLRYADCN